MDMRVRGKRPHGQQKVGGPTLKTLCLGTVGVGNRSARRELQTCTHRAKFRRQLRFLAIGDFFAVWTVNGHHLPVGSAGLQIPSFSVASFRVFDFAPPRCILLRLLSGFAVPV